MLVNLLQECFQENPMDRPENMRTIAKRLIEIYQKEIGKSYLREKPDPAELRADSLNNKALSMLDLGKNDEAVTIWKQSLNLDPHHCESTYNLDLLRWRQGHLTDSQVLVEMRTMVAAQPDLPRPLSLLGQIHLERGDINSAQKLIEEAIHHAPDNKDLIGLQATAASLPHSGWVTDITGQERYIHALDFTSDGKYLLAGGVDELCLWDWENRELVRRFSQPDNTFLIDDLAILPGDKLAITGGGTRPLGEEDKTLRLWNLITGECLHIYEGHSNKIYSIALSADGKHVISGGFDHTIRVWEVESGRCLKIIRTPHVVESIVYMPDGRSAISGHFDGNIYRWDLETTECLYTYKGHRGSIESIVLTPDGKHLVSSSSDQTLRLWDLETGSCIRIFEGHLRIPEHLAISPDGQHVLASGSGDALRLWKLDSGRCLRTYEEVEVWIESNRFCT